MALSFSRSAAFDLGMSQSRALIGPGQAGSGKTASASDIAALGKARGVVDTHLTKHASRIPPLDETINGKFDVVFKNLSIAYIFIDSVGVYGLYGGTERGMGAVLRTKGGVAPGWSFRAHRECP